MIDRETWFVFGKTLDVAGRYADRSISVAAYSSRFERNERVDTMYFASVGTHFGLNLPDGTYELLVFADIDGNRMLDGREVIGRRTVNVGKDDAQKNVMGQVDIALGQSFLEIAPTMFYTLEEDFGYKIPVIFVHGIDGTPRDFQAIIERLDRKRYKPWFFYYPTGGDLGQLAEFFYRIFLSGKVIPLDDMPMIVVAHSMGGLVVREALNRYEGNGSENKVRLLFTIASPLGGHAAAAIGEKHGLLVLPSWRDLNPDSPFIRELYENPLPDFVRHELVYAYGNPSGIKLGENSDGVVALSSQLDPRAQMQSHGQFGFNSTHDGILKDDGLIRFLDQHMAKVEHVFPQSHLALYYEGGYEIGPEDGYGPLGRYYIRNVGKFLMGLARGAIQPVNENQVRFLRLVDGSESPSTRSERDWLRFMKAFHERGG